MKFNLLEVARKYGTLLKGTMYDFFVPKNRRYTFEEVVNIAERGKKKKKSMLERIPPNPPNLFGRKDKF